MERPDKYAEEKEVIMQIFREHKGRYGYRRITLELGNRGYILNEKTVHKLMGECGIKCEIRRKKYRSYKGNIGHVADNLLNRDFKSDKPNEKWVTDVTEFQILEEKVYLSPILDLFNGEIISYNISLRPKFAQVMNMLDKAFSKISDGTNLILHSDQGWQYRMERYHKKLAKKGIRQSMSRKGNCLDNAVIENFFGILKSEMFYENEFNSVEHLIAEIESYIDYYNNQRIRCKLKGLTPVDYRVQSLKIA